MALPAATCEKKHAALAERAREREGGWGQARGWERGWGCRGGEPSEPGASVTAAAPPPRLLRPRPGPAAPGGREEPCGRRPRAGAALGPPRPLRVAEAPGAPGAAASGRAARRARARGPLRSSSVGPEGSFAGAALPGVFFPAPEPGEGERGCYANDGVGAAGGKESHLGIEFTRFLFRFRGNAVFTRGIRCGVREPAALLWRSGFGTGSRSAAGGRGTPVTACCPAGPRRTD